jgi:hypothetical protein
MGVVEAAGVVDPLLGPSAILRESEIGWVRLEVVGIWKHGLWSGVFWIGLEMMEGKRRLIERQRLFFFSSRYRDELRGKAFDGCHSLVVRHHSGSLSLFKRRHLVSSRTALTARTAEVLRVVIIVTTDPSGLFLRPHRLMYLGYCSRLDQFPLEIQLRYLLD